MSSSLHNRTVNCPSPADSHPTSPTECPPPSSGSIKPTPLFNNVVTIPVLLKLLGFMVALVVVPIWTYYKALDGWFPGDTSLSALSAVVAVNLVVIGYVIVAILEGDTDGRNDKASTIRNDDKKAH